MRSILAALIILVSAVSAQAGEVRAVGNLDLNRYLGTWHEVARYPVIFQRGCTRSKAVYRKIDDRRISVTNSCVRNGKVTEIEGDAIVAGPGKLKVSFFRFLPFRADYWVLYVDKTYSTAVVGGPGRRAAWILSRTPNRSRASLAPALRALERNGYDISAIRFEGKQ